MEIRFVITKKGEEHPKIRLTQPPKEHYRAMVTLDGTPELVLKLLNIIKTYGAADAEEEMVIV